MKKSMLLLCAAMLAWVAGCSGGGGAPAAGGASSTAAGETPKQGGAAGSAPQAEAPPAQKPVTLKFWVTEKEGYAAEIEQFQQLNPQIKVEAVFMGNYDQMAQKVMAGIVAGDLPHVVQLGQRHGIPQIADSGKLIPIEEFMTPEEMNDIYGGFWDRFTYKGKKWTIPFQSSNPIFYYNQTLLEQKGLKAPETWDEMIEVGKKVTGGGVWGVNWGADTPWYYQAMVWNRGGGLIGQDGKLNINGKESVDTLRSLQDLVHVHKIMPPNQMKSAAEDFAAGKLAMYFRSGSSLASLTKQTGDKFKIGLAFLPKISERWIPIGGNALGIFRSDADHQAASWKLVSFLTTKEKTVDGAIKTGYIPIRKSAHELPAFKEHLAKDPNFKVSIDQVQHLRGQIIHPADALIWTELETAIEKVHSDAKANPQAILDSIQKEVEDYMKSY